MKWVRVAKKVFNMSWKLQRDTPNLVSGLMSWLGLPERYSKCLNIIYMSQYFVMLTLSSKGVGPLGSLLFKIPCRGCQTFWCFSLGLMVGSLRSVFQKGSWWVPSRELEMRLWLEPSIPLFQNPMQGVSDFQLFFRGLTLKCMLKPSWTWHELAIQSSFHSPLLIGSLDS